MADDTKGPSHGRWAHFRFSLVGRLLASPPARGELGAELLRLSQQRLLRQASAMRTHLLCDTLRGLVHSGRVVSTDAGYSLAP